MLKRILNLFGFGLKSEVGAVEEKEEHAIRQIRLHSHDKPEAKTKIRKRANEIKQECSRKKSKKKNVKPSVAVFFLAICLPSTAGCEAFLRGYDSPEADRLELEVKELEREYAETKALIDKYKAEGVTGIPLAEATQQLSDIAAQIKEKTELILALIEKAKAEAGPGILDVLGYLIGVLVGGVGGNLMERRKTKLLNTPPPMVPAP